MSVEQDCQHARDSLETPEVIEAHRIHCYCRKHAANVTKSVCDHCKDKIPNELEYNGKVLIFKRKFKPFTKKVIKRGSIFGGKT